MPAPPHPSILVVDDDADMRLYLAGCLRALAGGVVRQAADGAEALRMARAEAPDLIVTDLVMPGLGGAALCAALRADARTAGVRVLLVSGETRGPPPCADAFLLKPFDAATLRAHARHALA